jgi:hypothetical protein
MRRVNARLALFFLTFAALLGIGMTTGWILDGTRTLTWVAGAALVSAGIVGGTVFLIRSARDVRLAWLTRIWMARKGQNRCLRCGYDLRGSPRRCPECGNVHAAEMEV